MKKNIRGMLIALIFMITLVGCADREDKIVVKSSGAVVYTSKITVNKDKLIMLSDYNIEESQDIINNPNIIFSALNDELVGYGFKSREFNDDDMFGMEFMAEFKNKDEFNKAMNSLYSKDLVNVDPTLDIQKKSGSVKGFNLTLNYKYSIPVDLKNIFLDYSVDLESVLDTEASTYTLSVEMPDKVLNVNDFSDGQIDEDNSNIVTFTDNASDIVNTPKVIKVVSEGKTSQMMLLVGGSVVAIGFLVTHLVVSKKRRVS